MDLLLIDPARVYWGFGGGIGFSSPPVGMTALAGFLLQHGVDVDILDCNALEIGWDELGAEIRKRRPRCVGVSSSMTCYVPESFRCVEVTRRVDPEIVTVGGGLQFTLAPEECLRRCSSLDLIVRGDGEAATLELLAELAQPEPDLERVAGLSLRKDGGFVHTADRPPMEDLDALPLPAWHLLAMESYRLPVIPPRWGNYTIVVTARGCPFQCNFCSPKLGQAPYRALSAERVLEMLDHLYTTYGIRVFWFSDLSFNTGHPSHGEQDFAAMLSYAKELDPLIAIFTLAMPVPGTPFYDKMLAQGRIEDYDWSHYDFGHPVMRLDGLSRQQVLDLYDRCFRDFYKRAGKIIRHGILGDQFARYTYSFLRFVNSARQIRERNGSWPSFTGPRTRPTARRPPATRAGMPQSGSPGGSGGPPIRAQGPTRPQE